MRLSEFITDDDAVSPVIGVILMVAITVILAAVIGTFVLGLGDQVSSSAPQASFTFQYTSDTTDDSTKSDWCELTSGANNNLQITHDGGDTITASQLSLSAGSGASGWESCSALAAGSDVAAGDTANTEVEADDTVRVTWQSSGGDSTATLGKWTGPEA